ncbi:MAG: helix-turn-helix domain-containing protein [Propionibacteriales bacterium]|nr:helix-turn-helix domain-containing protein [Propionibacteriales bacterium]
MREQLAEAESMARFAALLADRSRASMCLALLDGRAWTAGELARHAGIGRPTASEHLTQLVDSGLLTEARQGRHRYLRLTGEAARLVEELTAFVGAPEDTPSSLRGVRARNHLATARTCYDHLAGRLGVAIFDAMQQRDLLAVADGLTLTPAGRAWFVELGREDALGTRRPVVRSCLDWTERRPHLAGAAGAALQHELLARSWIERGERKRAIRVTAAGRQGLADLLGIDATALTTPPS